MGEEGGKDLNMRRRRLDEGCEQLLQRRLHIGVGGDRLLELLADWE